MSKIRVRNLIKQVAKSKGVNHTLIALRCNVHYTTVSQWASNRQQPNIVHIVKILGLLEVEYNEIMVYDGSPVNTGLGKVLQEKYDELIKEFPLKVTIINEKSGKEEEIYNPIIVNALNDLEREHKKRNG